MYTLAVDEQKIADQLKQNITPPPDTVMPAVPEVDTTNGQATIAPDYPLDEMTQYKLHDYFGTQYKPSDEVTKQQIQSIYDTVAKMVPEAQYGYVVAKIRDLEQIIGTSHDERRVYKLYQWLKLDGIRKNVEAEMGALTYGQDR